jgi:hypothetical protein
MRVVTHDGLIPNPSQLEEIAADIASSRGLTVNRGTSQHLVGTMASTQLAEGDYQSVFIGQPLRFSFDKLNDVLAQIGSQTILSAKDFRAATQSDHVELGTAKRWAILEDGSVDPAGIGIFDRL